jgi:hypothetical protein
MSESLRPWGACAGALLAGLACQKPAPEPAMSPLEGAADGHQSIRGEFDGDVELTYRVDRLALRHPSLEATVGAEIRAMVSYVRERGRGEFVPERELASPGALGGEPALSRLKTTATRLLPFLGLDSGPRELTMVAVASLGRQLGEDAAYGEVVARGDVSAGDLQIEYRDGIGLVGFRVLGDNMSDRFQQVLDGWKDRTPPPRAIVLDLARCELGGPAAASQTPTASGNANI